MPLFYIDESNEKYKFAIWKRDESISYFLENMSLDERELSQIYGMVHTRILEWLSTRYLLKLILKDTGNTVFLKDQFGKPYISMSDKFISLSHSGKWVAAAVSDLPVGIDVEKISEKALRIKDKFASESELETEEADAIHLSKLWTIKEAAYKAYGKKGLVFKDQIRLKSGDECEILIDKNKTLDYFVYSQMFEDHIVSIAYQKD